MRTVLLHLIPIFQLYTCAVDYSHCRFLIDKSGALTENQEKEICKVLDSLSLVGLEVTVYLDDSLPKIVDEIRIKDHSFDQSPTVRLKAILFIGIKSNEYDVHYSEYIRDNDYLKARHKFQTAIYQARKKEIGISFFYKIVSEFKTQFGDRKGI